jgi:hypothetical protein
VGSNAIQENSEIPVTVHTTKANLTQYRFNKQLNLTAPIRNFLPSSCLGCITAFNINIVATLWKPKPTSGCRAAEEEEEEED